MAAQNPFALRAAVGPAVAHVARVWSLEEQAEALRNYIEVPREFWFALKYGEHIRYYTTDGKYHPGGLIRQNPLTINAKDTGAEQTFIKLQSGPNDKVPGYFSWLVAYDAADRIFVKPDACTLILLKAVNELSHKMSRK